MAAVITDVDGTLFPFGTSRAISPRNVAALERAMDRGVYVSLATGRIPGAWSDAIRAQLLRLGPGVFCNGCLGVDPDGEVLWQHPLPSAVVSAVAELSRERLSVVGGGKLSALAAAQGDDGRYRYLELAPDGPTWVSDLIASAREPREIVKDYDDLTAVSAPHVLKFVFFTRDDDDSWASMPAVIAALRSALVGLGAEVLDCGPRQCEVLPSGVCKGTGVLQLLQKIRVEPAAAMACGDAENDVEMLQVVGIGVAVANAKPVALAAADHVVASNDEDGVAEAVERFVLADCQAAEFDTRVQ